MPTPDLGAGRAPPLRSRPAAIGSHAVIHRPEVAVARLALLIYSCVVYLLFLSTFVYTMGFVENVPGLKTIDADATVPVWTAVLIDVLLLGIFALQHSVMARRGFKRWWTQYVPKAAERSTYVLAASLAVALMIWQWQPIDGVVWSVDGELAGLALLALSGLGWAVLLAATFMIDHLELFGLRQAIDQWRGWRIEPQTFRTPGLYRLVRHPIYVGFILAFWSTPHMSAGHLLFAVMSTGYILVGIAFEERDLVAQFGVRYLRYKAEVGMLLPRIGLGRKRAADADFTGATERPGSDGHAPGGRQRQNEDSLTQDQRVSMPLWWRR
jgi:methanethiol S-methyltransferase